MGVAVIAVVFVAGLFGVPTLFGHGTAHAGQTQTQTQTASAQEQSAHADAQTRPPAPATEVASDGIVRP